MCPKIHILILLGAIPMLVASCGKAQDKNSNSRDNSANTGGANYAVIPFDEAYYNLLFKDAKPAKLSTDEIREVESLLQESIEDYNREPYPLRAHPEYNLDKSRFFIDLSGYKRQFIPVLNAKGEKEVWVNCFCEDQFDNWRKEIIQVKDGGKCFFNVKINLNKKIWYDLRVNGEA